MENAIKSLMIAGSVLASILVISLGIIIFNKNSAEEQTSSLLSSIETANFNKRYELLQGKHKGSTVNTVLGYAISDNQSLQQGYKSGETINICVNIRSNAKDILENFKSSGEIYRALTTREYGVRYVENIELIRSVVDTQKTYNIWYSYNNSGLIWEIHIDDP